MEKDNNDVVKLSYEETEHLEHTEHVDQMFSDVLMCCYSLLLGYREIGKHIDGVILK